MIDPFPLNISNITDDELRFTSRHLAAAIASLDNAYHFGNASLDLKQHISAAVMAVERIHASVNTACTPEPRVYPPADATMTTSPVVQRPDGVYEAHSEARFSGPLRNAQNIPKPETP